MTPAEFLAALRAAVEAGSDGDCLAAVVAAVDPEATAPTPEALAVWSWDCPADARDRTGQAVADLAEHLVEHHGDLIPAGWTAPEARMVLLARVTSARRLADVSALWLAARDSGFDGRHPLAPLVRAWAKRPPIVAAATRADPLLPVVQSVREAPEREAGRLAFAGILDGRELPAQLPMFPAPEGPRVPLLELADYRGGPIMARGRGAPLDLRLFVGACLLTEHEFRAARARLAVTVGELRDWLFPNGWERRRDWPRVRAALWKARDYTIPDGKGLWLPFALRGDPGAGAGLCDEVVIDVELPPGSAHGPKIDRRTLAALGVESAPRFRAYLAAHSVAWRPGATRVPHPRNTAVKLWTGDPDKYPILTAADRRRLAYGEGDKRNRTRSGKGGIDTPWEGLPGVEVITRSASTTDGRRGWIIVPAKAAEAIRRRAERARRGGR